MTTLPLTFGSTVAEADFQLIQNRMALDFCKWDSQIGDVSTLFRQPVLISPGTWRELKQMAEDLAAELMTAEEELLDRPELYSVLGLPKQLRSIFEDAREHGLTPCSVRTLRFDFHYTTEGWRVSEVNSDVPGGYTEASRFTQLVCDRFPGTHSAGNPGTEWAESMHSVVGGRGHIALLSAPGFIEDQQVTAFLACELQARDINTFLLHHPSQLNWKQGQAGVLSEGKELAIDAIVRFYQGEWLAKLPSSCGWKWLFLGGKTPVSNSAPALLTESKRFPLTWDMLSSKMNRWKVLLPECRDPREGCHTLGDSWVLKASYSNTGDDVHMRESTDRETWGRLCRSVERHPERWILQRRFVPTSISSHLGPVYPCIGVYTINGRTAGVYARASVRRVTDYAAMDVALLIDEDIDAKQG
jgi:glutathionylspermidine synthase